MPTGRYSKLTRPKMIASAAVLSTVAVITVVDALYAGWTTQRLQKKCPHVVYAGVKKNRMPPYTIRASARAVSGIVTKIVLYNGCSTVRKNIVSYAASISCFTNTIPRICHRVYFPHGSTFVISLGIWSLLPHGSFASLSCQCHGSYLCLTRRCASGHPIFIPAIGLPNWCSSGPLLR